MPLFKKESSEKKFEIIENLIRKTKDRLKVIDFVIDRRDAEIKAREKEITVMMEAGREISPVIKVAHMRKVESLNLLRDFRETIMMELDRLLEVTVANKPLTKAQEEWLKGLDGTVDELVTWRDNDQMFEQTAKRILDDFDKMFKERPKAVKGEEVPATTKQLI
ncbi:MAG: hypothetical protein KIH08_07440, partial [Candidatus Freyarchaeota archaeon]|nr:hypothetical protein [Candidatus Jordarchaeia archaeon]